MSVTTLWFSWIRMTHHLLSPQATSTDMFSSFYQSRRYDTFASSLPSTPSLSPSISTLQMPSPFLPSRQGTQRDDFTLLAERVKKQQRRTASEDDFFSSGGSLPRHLLRPSMSLGAPQVSLSTRNTVRSTVGSTSRSPRLSIR